MNSMQNLCRSTLGLRSDLLCRRLFPASSGCKAGRCGHPGGAATPANSSAWRRRAPGNSNAVRQRFANGPWNVQHNIVVGSKEKQVKLDRTIGVVMDEAEMIKDVNGNNLMVAHDIWRARQLEGCSHRDGSIYSEKWKDWISMYGMDIADREETASEPKALSIYFDCYPDQDNCNRHVSSDMIQIFSLSLAKTPINSGSIQLYGYMAARDDMDGKLNYVFNRGRDDPIIVQEGSSIEMTGPKRGIIILDDLLFEFDVRMNTGEKEEDDIQLIDGVIHYSLPMSPTPTTIRISGNCGGAVDMDYTLVESGVAAVVEVVISEVQSDFSLSLSSILSIREQLKEVELFDGRVGGEMGMRRSVLAVPLDTTMHLKLKVCQEEGDAVHYCSFDARLHGCTHRELKLEMACIAMKVTWSPRPPWF